MSEGSMPTGPGLVEILAERIDPSADEVRMPSSLTLREPLDELRLQTMATLRALAQRHGLPAPLGIAGRVHAADRPVLYLDLESREQVDRWAEVLGIAGRDEYENLYQAWSVSFEPVWLGWHHVYIRFHRFDGPAVTS